MRRRDGAGWEGPKKPPLPPPLGPLRGTVSRGGGGQLKGPGGWRQVKGYRPHWGPHDFFNSTHLNCFGDSHSRFAEERYRTASSMDPDSCLSFRKGMQFCVTPHEVLRLARQQQEISCFFSRDLLKVAFCVDSARK